MRSLSSLQSYQVIRLLRLALGAVFASSLWLSNPVDAQSSDIFKALLADHYDWLLKNNPITASNLGDHRYDTTLGELSVASMNRNADIAADFLKRVNAIDPLALTDANRINWEILRRMLQNQIDANRYPERFMLFTNRHSWHSDISGLGGQVPFFTKADFESYIARLNDVPRYNADGIETTKAGLAAGVSQFCTSMLGFDKTISTNITSNIETSVFMQPFTKKPTFIENADWNDLHKRALIAVTDKVMPAFKKLLIFYKKDYQPKCRASAGVASLPQGNEFYAYRARTQTTTDLTPLQIHQIGLSEVARIRTEMEAVVKASGFKGNRADFVKHMRSDPKYIAASADALLEKTSALMKHIDGELPKLFGRLPRLPYTVKAMEDDVAPGNTTAYYEPGQAESGRPGVYRVNTTDLTQRPLYELPSLSLHEAVPGHHLQIALQQELDMPQFRRQFAEFTAFVEGWGLYSESLGTGMGLYDTPEKDYSRLSYEMWRACRLVVDTGLHTMDWTRDQAIAYMLDNTALSKANVEAEVDRYITWPGQALAYKIGELKIRSLRAAAEKKLGNKFDIRRFHDAVLENGPVPLAILEAHINQWIIEQESTK